DAGRSCRCGANQFSCRKFNHALPLCSKQRRRAGHGGAQIFAHSGCLKKPRGQNCVVGFRRGVRLVQSMSDKALKMVTCNSCETKVFIPGDLAPLATVPCSKCGHPIMMPMMLRQFELRSFVASGGNGTVYRGWDIVLERLVAVKLMKKEL